MATKAGTTWYFCSASRTENVLRKPTCAFSAPMASMEAAKVVPTSILKARPVILLKQSAIAVPALVILPVSPEGTKVITMGLSAAPKAPAAGAAGAEAILSQTGAGGGVGVGGAAVGGTSVGAAVGGTSVAAGAAVAGTSVGAGTAVGSGVAAGPQAARTTEASNRTENSR